MTPLSYHGPLLAYAALPPAWIAGQRRYADLDEWTIRTAPALAGFALVLISFRSCVRPPARIGQHATNIQRCSRCQRGWVAQRRIPARRSCRRRKDGRP